MPRPSVPEIDVYPRHAIQRRKLRGRRRLPHLVLPRHTWKPLMWELNMAWVRLRTWRVPERYRDARDLLINIGPGHHAREEGWVNVDAVVRKGVNCWYDCRKGLPFPDGSARGIFFENLFEHLDYTEEVPAFLSECHRVLAPGGVLRLILPDARLLLDAYQQPGWSGYERIYGLTEDHTDLALGGRYHTKMELLNVGFRLGFQHRWMYDFETLDFVLRLCGFETVIEQEFNKSAMPELCLDEPHLRRLSLYVEAIRQPDAGTWSASPRPR